MKRVLQENCLAHASGVHHTALQSDLHCAIESGSVFVQVNVDENAHGAEAVGDVVDQSEIFTQVLLADIYVYQDGQVAASTDWDAIKLEDIAHIIAKIRHHNHNNIFFINALYIEVNILGLFRDYFL